MVFRALGSFGVSSVSELIELSKSIRGTLDLDPGLVPPDLADEMCNLADELESRGVKVVPSRKRRQQRLSVALKKI